MSDQKLLSKTTLTITAAVVVLMAAGGLVWAKHSTTIPSVSYNRTVAPTAQQPATKADATVSYDGVAGKNALELLKTKATVVTKQSSYGEYVDTINGVQGGTDGKYWAFYVNGTLAQVGAADYQTKAGDKITWKFE